MKVCSVCEKTFPPSEFHKNPGYKDGLQRKCKICTKAYNEVYNSDPGVKQRQKKLARIHHLKKNGLTPERFDEMLAGQNNCCAICFTDSPGGVGTWHIDHDHACCPGRFSCGNCVRGLLCMSCNHGLGVYEAKGESFARYLKKV